MIIIVQNSDSYQNNNNNTEILNCLARHLTMALLQIEYQILKQKEDHMANLFQSLLFHIADL